MQEEATTLDGQEALDQKSVDIKSLLDAVNSCLLYTSPSPRDYAASRMPSSA